MRISDWSSDVCSSDLIKVERPDGGDASRNLYLADLAFDRDSALFHAINRGKLSVAADLKDAGDLANVRALIAEADVLIHIRSEEHTPELQSLMRTSYAGLCCKKIRDTNDKPYATDHLPVAYQLKTNP